MREYYMKNPFSDVGHGNEANWMLLLLMLTYSNSNT